jgi:hypothetical protein
MDENHPSLNDQFYYHFIAQKYQQIFPESVAGTRECIEGDFEEILILNDQNAQIVRVKAVQELIRENQELKKRVEKLEQIVNQLLEK